VSLRIKTAKNVASGWLSLLIHVAVGFFLSPFILHKLGDAAFGLWVLIFSLTGYYGLFDFGIRSSVVRYVARFAASQDADQLTRFLNTSVATYGLVALMVLVVTGIGSFYLGSLFQIPPNLLQTARWLLVLVGTEVALGFPLSVFVGVIEGCRGFPG
jgi:O-antigen/teichoic acid export membrane protein